MDPTKAIIGGCSAVAVLGLAIVFWMERPAAPPAPVEPVAVAAEPTRELPPIFTPPPMPEPVAPPAPPPPPADPHKFISDRIATLIDLDVMKARVKTEVDKVEKYSRTFIPVDRVSETSPLRLYIHTARDRPPALLMEMIWRSDDWVFAKSIKVAFPDRNLSFSMGDAVHKVMNDGSGVRERGVVDISDNLELLERFSMMTNSDEIIVRFQGPDGFADRTLGLNSKEEIQVMMRAFYEERAAAPPAQ